METPRINYIAQLIAHDMQEPVEEARTFGEQHRDDIQKEFPLLLEDNAGIQQLTDILFPTGIEISDVFYSRLSDAHYSLGREQPACEVLGKVWAEAYKRLPESEGTNLLDLLPLSNSHIFFVLPSLPVFLSHVVLPDEFIASWFLSLAGKVATDLAGGHFFEAVHTHAIRYPGRAVKVFETYLREKLDGFRLDLGVIMLGALRASVDKEILQKASVAALEERLRGHPNVTFRHCYNRSWIGYFGEGTISREALFEAIDEMFEWTSEDMDDAFWILSRCILRREDDSTFLNAALQWFMEKTGPDLPIGAKTSVASLLLRLHEKARIQGSGVTLETLDALLLTIQPVAKDQKHVWHLLELYLVKRLKDNEEAFEQLIRGIANRAPELLPVLLNEHQLTYLARELASANVSSLVTDLLLSESTPERRLGRAVIEEIQITELDDALLKSKSNNRRLQILLLEMARRPFIAEKASGILLLFLPCYQDAEPSLRNEFIEEMTLQAINYPSACYGAWKEIASPPPLLTEVLHRAQAYFDGLESVRSCPGGSLMFPEWEMAFKEWQRRFANEVSEGARRASVFAQLVRHIDIIYGSEWSIAGATNVSDPQPMTEFSHGTEVPRLEILV